MEEKPGYVVMSLRLQFAGGSDAVQLFALSFSDYRVGQGSYADFKFACPFRHIVLIK